MLRRFAGSRRRADEDFVDWIVRATHLAHERARTTGIRFWVDAHLRCKWRWAGHVMRQEVCRLARKVTTWRDSAWWLEERTMPRRLRVMRPRRDHWFRWEDDFKRFFEHMGTGPWQEVTACRQSWQSHVDAFVEFCT